MKKTMKKVLAVVLAVMTLMAIAVPAFAANKEDADRISITEARTIAFERAGVAAGDVNYAPASLEQNEDGVWVYKVEFCTYDDLEFTVVINAETGEVLSFAEEADLIFIHKPVSAIVIFFNKIINFFRSLFQK